MTHPVQRIEGVPAVQPTEDTRRSTRRPVPRQRLRSTNRCPECGAIERITDRDEGEEVCRDCGLVLRTTMLSRKPEWRAFTLQERAARRRVGAPIHLSYYDKGLTTTFRPSEGTRSGQRRFTMRRLRKWHIRARLHTTVERNLSQAMDEVKRLSERLQIPSRTRETAAVIYRKALRQGLVRGRSIAAMAAASLYAACRLAGIPRTLRGVVTASSRTRKEIARCYRLILREYDQTMPIDGPAKYIPKIASTLHLNQTVQTRAVAIVRDAQRQQLAVGKGPVGIAAAAIYLASKLHGVDVTQRELATASQVTEVTIRNRSHGLLRGLPTLQNQLAS